MRHDGDSQEMGEVWVVVTNNPSRASWAASGRPDGRCQGHFTVARRASQGPGKYATLWKASRAIASARARGWIASWPKTMIRVVWSWVGWRPWSLVFRP